MGFNSGFKGLSLGKYTFHMQYCFHARCHVGGRSKKYYLCTVL